MKQKLAAILLILALLFALSACASSDMIKGSGTEEDPWLCGADKDDDVRVFVIDNSLWINGTGKMMDFEELEARPWNNVIGDISGINIFDELQYVGKNAFKGAGSNCDYVDLYLGNGIAAIGDSAFEGVNFTQNEDGFVYSSIITIPESVESIGARAFADSELGEVYIDGAPAVADDAFAGNTCKLYVRNYSGFVRLPYGGEIEYVTTYAFNYVEDYGSEDLSGEGTMYVPDGENLEYNAQDYVGDENYEFDRWEVVSGDLNIEEPENPEINVSLTGDVQVIIHYKEIS